MLRKRESEEIVWPNFRRWKAIISRGRYGSVRIASRRGVSAIILPILVGIKSLDE